VNQRRNGQTLEDEAQEELDQPDLLRLDN
jgi:SWI/SNF-related matrix-associated actin-dependent regulator of chromatin subfamily A member 5